MEKLLTITVPSYNVEKFLEQTISTFLADEVMDDIEILIVNDGSTDHTAEIGEKLQRQYPGTVVLVNKENGGHGSTINKGIELAHGKYFKVVDGDDWVDTKQFIEYVEKLRELDVDVIMTPFNYVSEETQAIERRTFQDIQYNKIYNVDDIIVKLGHQYRMHSTTFKTYILRQIPKISEHCFYVDQEYIIYPVKYIQTMCFLDYAIYQYRVGNIQQSMNWKNMQKNRNMHKKVTLNILDFLLQEQWNPQRKLFLEQRVAGLCQLQIDIYFSMASSKQVKDELVEFCELIRQRDEKVFQMIPGKKMKLLKKGNYRFYNLISRLKGTK